MQDLPKRLKKKIENRTSENALRSMGAQNNLIDFSSNDYLGFSTNSNIFKRASELLKEHHLEQNGATGSRLLSGNHSLYAIAETAIASFHNVEEALIFNSGYDANLGFFSAIPQRGDLIFFDELCHASIRDGIAMSNAKSYKFTHNNLEDLKAKCQLEHNRNLSNETEVYVVTESVFSMDGDSPDLTALAHFCQEQGFHLIIDEAHALGAIGSNGEGLIQHFELEHLVFARLVTFGKALGCHGAAILGSNALKTYLINFARSFIYTTALPPHSVATILAAYEHLQSKPSEIKKIHSNIAILHNKLTTHQLHHLFVPSSTAIQCCILPGNEHVKQIAQALQKEGIDVKAILSPTVPQGQERLRICLHSFNTEEEIKQLALLMTNLL